MERINALTGQDPTKPGYKPWNPYYKDGTLRKASDPNMWNVDAPSSGASPSSSDSPASLGSSNQTRTNGTSSAATEEEIKKRKKSSTLSSSTLLGS